MEIKKRPHVLEHMEGCGRLTCLGAIGRLWSWEQVAKEAVEIEDRRVEFLKQRSRTSGSLEASCPKCNLVKYRP